jgi:predicted methyltransferase
MKTFTRTALVAMLILMGAAGAHAERAAPAFAVAAVADTDRPAADRERDANRKPAETIAFAGVRPGMDVAELGPGKGYYTRILARAVGPKGKVFALVSKAQAGRPGGLDALNALAAAYPNITVLTVDYPALVLPEKVNLVWTTENYHDFHNGPTANIAALDKGVYDSLKPGGIFYVEDHSAAVGAGLEATSKWHRMDEAVARAELTTAGFKIDGESNLLRNPNDNRASANSEAGHFVTDRFMLRLKK